MKRQSAVELKQDAKLAPAGYDDLIKSINSENLDKFTSQLKTLTGELTTEDKLKFLSYVNQEGMTLLHFAIKVNSVDMVTLLLKALGENAKDCVNQANKHGHTPIHYAALFGSVEMLNLLLDTVGDKVTDIIHGSVA